jgi:hypothetical protein
VLWGRHKLGVSYPSPEYMITLTVEEEEEYYKKRMNKLRGKYAEAAKSLMEKRKKQKLNPENEKMVLLLYISIYTHISFLFYI